MLRQVISRVATYSRPLIPVQKCITNSLIAPQVGIASPKIILSSQLHTGCLVKPDIVTRLITIPMLRGPLLSSRLQGLLPETSPSLTQTRGVIKWSLKKGKRKTVKVVLKKFKRLNWAGRGIWIRAIAGANKRIWKKNNKRKHRSRQHVFCNATQSNMLDKMVTRYWRKPRHYPDDPYRPYMKREGFSQTNLYPREYF